MKNITLNIIDMIPMTTPAIDNLLLSSLFIPATPLTIDKIPNINPNIGTNPTNPKANASAPFLFSDSIF